MNIPTFLIPTPLALFFHYHSIREKCHVQKILPLTTILLCRLLIIQVNLAFLKRKRVVTQHHDKQDLGVK